MDPPAQAGVDRGSDRGQPGRSAPDPAPAPARAGGAGRTSAPRTSTPAPRLRPSTAGPRTAPSLAAQAARAAANVAATPQGPARAGRYRPAATNRLPPPVCRLAGPSNRPANLKDALLAEIKKAKAVFYNMVVAQAQKIEVAGDRVTFSFTPAQRALKDQFEQQKAWLESVALASPAAGSSMASAQADASAAPPAAAAAAAGGAEPDKQSAEKKSALREQALADAGVQTMLEVFPAEIRDVEEM